MSKYGIAVVGASGYSGEELLRLLLRHPDCEIRIITSRQYAGKAISSVFPRFSSISEIVFSEPDTAKIAKECQFAFLALPHGLASEFARPLLKSGVKVLDLSADFRIKNTEKYKEYYKEEHPAPELLAKAVYGLPEIYRDKIKEAKIVACPGCYPTSVIIPLYPLLRAGLLNTGKIFVSSMSGVSGAGRKVELPYIFPECSESLRSYSPVKHRHLPEIEQELSSAAGEEIAISFVPHLVPVNRGIVSTIVAEVSDKFSNENLDKALSIYKNNPFVRVMPKGLLPDTKNVLMSNFCDVSYTFDEHTRRLIISSCIDNLTKGAAGQAIQCFNIMLNIDEKTALIYTL
jgi:N-acetyl-gamma-glutamyl-phosphate reductase